MSLFDSYNNVKQRICDVSNSRPITLIAVSKTKPMELISELHQYGHRDFGENYAQECVSKASSLPTDITWHFIGPVQSNKVKSLAQINIVVHTIDRIKIADLFNKEAQKLSKVIPVFVQVNVSEDDAKSGTSSDSTLAICSHIVSNCMNLQLLGLMTIGRIGDVSAFTSLKSLADEISESVGVPLKCSMGMSGDFEEAIRRGSDYVRVGSSIFGERNYSSIQKE
ncbi:hypothetical protein GEMRC1_012372 [Eukaryota sp. GEM-RC1]